MSYTKSTEVPMTEHDPEPKPRGWKYTKWAEWRRRNPEATQGERRQYSKEYKILIVEEAELCRGQIGKLVKQEGLQYSHISAWRKNYPPTLYPEIPRKLRMLNAALEEGTLEGPQREFVVKYIEVLTKRRNKIDFKHLIRS